jgi:hypothetical protein
MEHHREAEVLEKAGDEEAQRPSPPISSPASNTSKSLYLAAWFMLNLGLTISNKAILGKVSKPHQTKD